MTEQDLKDIGAVKLTLQTFRVERSNEMYEAVRIYGLTGHFGAATSSLPINAEVWIVPTLEKGSDD